MTRSLLILPSGLPEAWLLGIQKWYLAQGWSWPNSNQTLADEKENLELYAGPLCDIPACWELEKIAVQRISHPGYLGASQNTPESIFKLPYGALIYCPCQAAQNQLLQWRPDYTFTSKKVQEINWQITTGIFRSFEKNLIPEGLNRFEIPPEQLVPHETQQLMLVYWSKANAATWQNIPELNNPQEQRLFIHNQLLLRRLKPLKAHIYSTAEAETQYQWLFSSYIIYPHQNSSVFLFGIKKGRVLETLREELAHSLAKKLPERVFVSRPLSNKSPLLRLCAKLKIGLQHQSLTELQLNPIKQWPETEWVFFTSKILLESYFNASPPYTKVRYACWGADLAKRLRQMGCRADFIGATQRPPLLAKQFQLILKKDRVVFPVIKNAPPGIGSLMTGSHVILLEMGVQKQSTLHLAETFDMAFLNNLQQTEAFIKNRATARTYVVSSRSAGKLILSRGIKAVQEWEGFDDFGIWMGIQQFK